MEMFNMAKKTPAKNKNAARNKAEQEIDHSFNVVRENTEFMRTLAEKKY